MFVVTVHFKVTDGGWETFFPAMIENARTSKADEPGCLRFDVCTSPDRPGEIFLYEIYANETAFEAHTKTAHFADFSTIADPLTAEKSVATYWLEQD
ncbi:MAG: putative quinol monooxygenase [Pseudomonadota bacterium]